jgi:bacillithiol system protein YtxJ
MNWISLTREEQLSEIKSQSFESFLGIAIFKHSTRCYISVSAKKRLEGDWNFKDSQLPVYFLDLLAYRPISDKIASVFNVHHQSPQILLIKDGKCFYDASHSDVSVENIKKALLHGESASSPFNR